MRNTKLRDAKHKPVLLPGIKPVTEMLSNNPGCILRVYWRARANSAETALLQELCRRNNIPAEEASNEFLDSLCQGRTVAHQGAVAELRPPEHKTLEEIFSLTLSAPLPLLIALDQVQDPGNLGAVSRTAWCLGCSGLLIPEHNSAAAGPAAYKASAGAFAQIPLTIVTNLARALDSADEHGFAIYAASAAPAGGVAPVDAFACEWEFPAILVLGGEEKGVRPGVLRRCRFTVRIPHARPFESLNVAQAGAVLIGLCAARRACSARTQL